MEGGFFRCLLGSAFVCVCCFLKELCVGQRVLCVLCICFSTLFCKRRSFSEQLGKLGRDDCFCCVLGRVCYLLGERGDYGKKYNATKGGGIHFMPLNWCSEMDVKITYNMC